jgi:Holliday junction DNA helicase RuvA
LPTQATVDVGGVGYEVLIPLSSYDRLPPVGQAVQVLTHLHVREDAHILYGFMSVAERDLFRLLVNSVSGIGPKLALAVLSGIGVGQFQSRRRERRCCVAFEDQRASAKDGRAHRARVKDKGGRRGGVGSGQRHTCAEPAEEQANEAVLRLDRARLQAGRRAQDRAAI